ncbi:rRNA maturation RNase YbeY [Beggiatoa alba]|nr:rRNA maturation RNase YbeY [Beggiatoa alba]
MYADVTVPDDHVLQQWASQSIHYLFENKSDYELSIRVVDIHESQFLNSQYRQKNKPTNVLSFPFEMPDIFKEDQQTTILGDIVVCAPIIEMESQQQKKSTQEHWAHMIVHGVLHLLGYDHINNKEAEAMEALEIKILAHFGYPNPYLELAHE